MDYEKWAAVESTFIECSIHGMLRSGTYPIIGW